MCRKQHGESRKMKKQRNTFQTKEQDKSPETDLNKTEISDLYDRELKLLMIKKLTEVRRGMHKVIISTKR